MKTTPSPLPRPTDSTGAFTLVEGAAPKVHVGEVDLVNGENLLWLHALNLGENP